MIYLLYGQPGTGKTTLATGIALDYLREGRRLVSNYAIDAAPASYKRRGRMADAYTYVLPSRPSFEELESIGLGWHDPSMVGREDLAGLLLIDEAGPWLDSRKWNDKDRANIIDWLLHSRKRGWDVLLIAQAPALVDKQVREAVIESYVRIRRTDRLKVLGMVKFPRLHIGVARYGLDINAPVLQRWFYRGQLEHKCFNSYALFDTEGGNGPYCTLPARLTKWAGVPAGVDAWVRTLLGKPVKAPLPGGAGVIGGSAQPPPMTPRHPVVDLLRSLPSELRIPEFRRLQRLGYV